MRQTVYLSSWVRSCAFNSSISTRTLKLVSRSCLYVPLFDCKQVGEADRRLYFQPSMLQGMLLCARIY